MLRTHCKHLHCLRTYIAFCIYWINDIKITAQIIANKIIIFTCFFFPKNHPDNKNAAVNAIFGTHGRVQSFFVLSLMERQRSPQLASPMKRRGLRFSVAILALDWMPGLPRFPVMVRPQNNRLGNFRYSRSRCCRFARPPAYILGRFW